MVVNRLKIFASELLADRKTGGLADRFFPITALPLSQMDAEISPLTTIT